MAAKRSGLGKGLDALIRDVNGEKRPAAKKPAANEDKPVEKKPAVSEEKPAAKKPAAKKATTGKEKPATKKPADSKKPAEPKSHWCTPPFYVYKKEDVSLVQKGIDSGCGVDAPGSFIAWLSAETTVHAFEMPGRRYDIGNLASYEQVQKEYKGITE